ncbi:MAG: Smr/MutS family protein [Lautropia sp.]
MARRDDRLGLADLGVLKAELQAAEAARQAEAAAAAARARARAREARIFQQAVAGVAPLAPTGRRAPDPPAVEPIARQRQLDEQRALAESLSDEIDVERWLETDERLSFRRAGVGPDALARLRRGHWVCQSQLDLHGLRSDEARAAVGEFLARCVRAGLRCVRVIHGKGLGSANRQPVLKDKAIRWLAQRNEVIAFCQAPPFAGGTGALLVLLRTVGGS